MKTNEQIINEIISTFGIKNQSELAKEIGLHAQAVSNWKNSQNIEVSKLKKRFPSINANYILSKGTEGNLLLETPMERLILAFETLGLDLESVYKDTNIVPGYFDDKNNKIDKKTIDLVSGTYPEISKEYVIHGKGVMLHHVPASDSVNEPTSIYGNLLPKNILAEISEKYSKMEESVSDFKKIMMKYNLLSA